MGNDGNINSFEKYNIAYDELKLERARQGRSIGEVAELAGLDPKTISRIEQQKVIPRPQTIGKIARALGKDYDDFLYPKKVGSPGESKSGIE